MPDAVLLQTAFVSLLSALVGGAFVHILAGRRDRDAKRRELLTTQLIKVWQDIDEAGGPLTPDGAKKLESAVMNLQLVGNEEIISMVRKLAKEMEANGTWDTTELLLKLRAQLRSELGLTPTNQPYIALRIFLPKIEKRK